jgi:hypothetical protein
LDGLVVTRIPLISRQPNHDTGYKLLFSHARVVEDLLRGFVGEDWVEGLDYTTLKDVFKQHELIATLTPTHLDYFAIARNDSKQHGCAPYHRH